MDRRAIYSSRDEAVLSQQAQHRSNDILGFRPSAEVFEGSRLQTHAIKSHIVEVEITPDTPHEIIVQYARAIALLLLGEVMCPDSSGNMAPLLYLTKLENIVEAKNYSWGSAVLAFLYRELCNASAKGKTAIGGALQLLQIWAWSRIIPLCPVLGVERVYMGQVQIDNNRLLPSAPYGAIWNCEHNFTWTVRTTVRVIRDILDKMQADQFIWQPYDMDSDVIVGYATDFNSQLWRSTCPLILYAIVEMHYPERVLRQFDGKDDMTRSYKDHPFPIEEIQNKVLGMVHNITRHFVSSSTDRRVESGYQPGDAPILQIVLDEVNALQAIFQSRPQDIEGYRQLVDRVAHGVQNIKKALTHQPHQIATSSDNAPTTSHRQRRNSSRMSIEAVEHDDVGLEPWP
ncbi:UNVERIFIED_CONTAM: protein MAINTENANCE OF MERISTEMS [Sesamum calycinum]|uniref:Protein MAINTENANCE OF MERISTEMS n=1 Tax=Sesamum calycinum TaxID=2727403 RepID=A0AAW2N428_9LAMI